MVMQRHIGRLLTGLWQKKDFFKQNMRGYPIVRVNFCVPREVKQDLKPFNSQYVTLVFQNNNSNNKVEQEQTYEKNICTQAWFTFRDNSGLSFCLLFWDIYSQTITLKCNSLPDYENILVLFLLFRLNSYHQIGLPYVSCLSAQQMSVENFVIADKYFVGWIIKQEFLYWDKSAQEINVVLWNIKSHSWRYLENDFQVWAKTCLIRNRILISHTLSRLWFKLIAPV